MFLTRLQTPNCIFENYFTYTVRYDTFSGSFVPLMLRFHVHRQRHTSTRQTVTCRIAGCRMASCLFPIPPLYTARFRNWQEIVAQSYLWVNSELFAITRHGNPFSLGTVESSFGNDGHVKRVRFWQINGLTERNMGTVVLFLYLFVSLPVCRMRFAGQQKRMHGNGA